jgi:hypothetical protein
MNRADAVTKVCSVIPSCASNGSMMNGKNHRITLVGREHFNPRLPTRPLFSEDKFAALKILPSLAQEECDLKRKHDFAVEILVETIEIADAIFQKQGGWALLARAMTLLDESRKLFRIPRPVTPEPTGPFIRNRCKTRINGRPNLLD